MRRAVCRRLFVALFLFFMAVAFLPARVALAEYVEGEVLVSYKEPGVVAESEGDVPPDPAASMLDLGYNVQDEIETDGVQTTVVAEVPEGTTVEEAVSELQQMPGVVIAQPNYVYALVQPTLVELAYGELATQSNVNDWKSMQPNLVTAHVFDAWDYAMDRGYLGSPHAISVAVLDTGCMLEHPEFYDEHGGNVDKTHAWDFTGGPKGVGRKLDGSGIANYGDDQGHGTHVCGVVAAGGLSIRGASYNASVVPVKVLDSNGYGTTSNIVSAIQYVRGLKAKSVEEGGVPGLRVINMSLGGEEEEADVLFERAVNEATVSGILCVCSAGNDAKESKMIPSDYESALSVMSISAQEQFSYFDDYNAYKDIAAVGEDVYSTYLGSGASTTWYATLTGTSMAAPLVSGVAALVWSVNPSMSPAQVRDVLLSTARDVRSGGSSKYWSQARDAGVKQIDAKAAMEAAIAQYGTQPSLTEVVPPNTVPTGTSFVYDGTERVAVSEGVGYTLTGRWKATDAGTYSATATLDEGCKWAGTVDDTTPRTYSWSITKAPLSVSYKTSKVAVDTLATDFPTDLTYEGLVSGDEAAALVSASKLDAPTPSFASVPLTSDKATTAGAYTVTLSGGSATNYNITLKDTGKLIVTNGSVYTIPKATTIPRYDGNVHNLADLLNTAQINGGATGYFTLQSGEGSVISATDACTETSGALSPYIGKAALKSADDYWEDGTQTAEISWYIKPAPLAFAYDPIYVLRGTPKSQIPNNPRVTGFVGNDTLESLRARTTDKLVLPGFLLCDANPILMPDTITSVVGDHQIIPDFNDSAANATRNYYFSDASAFTLHVCEGINVPGGTNRVYNGSSQQGVASSGNYSLSGTVKAVNTGTYTTKVTPAGNRLWKDGTRTTRSVSWSITKAQLSSVSISSVGNQTYTGWALTPKPTLRYGATTLREGTDYVLSYANNRSAGTATITATGRGNFAGSKSVSFRITDPAVTVAYCTHVQTYGWQGWRYNGASAGTTGQYKRLEGLQMSLQGAPYSGGIRYRAHVQTYGWQGWVSDGAVAGTTGQSKRLEALEVTLTGQMAEHYDVWYRAHAQTYGWLDWARNGERAGTATLSKRLEAVQVVVLPKGSAAPGPTARPYVTRLVRVQAHAQTYGWLGWAYEGEVAGTTGQYKRLEALRMSLSDQPLPGGIRYRAHVQTYGWQGWVSDGALAGTTGQSKRLEAVCVELTGQMAERYDVWYRAHAQTYGWMGWARNGEVAGTSGMSKRLEAVQVVLLPKGSAPPGTTANAYRRR